MIEDYLTSNSLKILVKPNSKKTEIIGWDKEKNALKINVNAHPEKGEANIEIVKFFKKIYKKDVRIKSGLTSKTKILEIL